MQRHKIFLFLLVANQMINANSYSQTGINDSDEQYGRAHLAYTSPMLLGVDQSTYAKCIKAENYLEPEKKSGKVIINGVDYVDDGRDNDLAAHDGILTSTGTFVYKKGESIVPRGQYKMASNSFILYDPEFRHEGKLSADKIKISCKFTWERCSSWPQQYQSICYRLCWPFSGHFVISECTVEYEFD